MDYLYWAGWLLGLIAGASISRGYLKYKDNHGYRSEAVTEAERDQAFEDSVSRVPLGVSGECICDTCIVEKWRPRWKKYRLT